MILSKNDGDKILNDFMSKFRSSHANRKGLLLSTLVRQVKNDWNFKIQELGQYYYCYGSDYDIVYNLVRKDPSVFLQYTGRHDYYVSVKRSNEQKELCEMISVSEDKKNNNIFGRKLRHLVKQYNNFYGADSTKYDYNSTYSFHDSIKKDIPPAAEDARFIAKNNSFTKKNCNMKSQLEKPSNVIRDHLISTLDIPSERTADNLIKPVLKIRKICNTPSPLQDTNFLFPTVIPKIVNQVEKEETAPAISQMKSKELPNIEKKCPYLTNTITETNCNTLYSYVHNEVTKVCNWNPPVFRPDGGHNIPRKFINHGTVKRVYSMGSGVKPIK